MAYDSETDIQQPEDRPTRRRPSLPQPGRLMVQAAEQATIRGMDTVSLDTAMNELQVMVEQFAMLNDILPKRLQAILREPEMDRAGPTPHAEGATPLASKIVQHVESLRVYHAMMVDVIDRVDL